jgi:hypothetical protein
MDVPPRAPERRPVHAPTLGVAADDDQLVGEHVVSLRRLARQRGLAGAARPRKHDTYLCVAQTAAVNQHPAQARQKRRVENAQQAVDRHRIDLAAAVPPITGAPAPDAGQRHVDLQIPPRDGDRARRRLDGERVLCERGEAVPRAGQGRRDEVQTQRDVVFHPRRRRQLERGITRTQLRDERRWRAGQIQA